jgi:hypothetical protein
VDYECFASTSSHADAQLRKTRGIFPKKFPNLIRLGRRIQKNSRASFFLLLFCTPRMLRIEQAGKIISQQCSTCSIAIEIRHTIRELRTNFEDLIANFSKISMPSNI